MERFKARWTALEVTAVILPVLFILIIAYLNWVLAILALIIFVAAYLLNYNTLHHRRRLAIESFDSMVYGVTQASNFAIQNLPVAIVVTNRDGVIGWVNSVFRDWTQIDLDKPQNIQTYMKSVRMEKIWGKSGKGKESFCDRHFSVFYKYIDNPDGDIIRNPDVEHMAFYFVDVTDAENARLRAEASQSVWGVIQVDNMDEVIKGMGDKEYTRIWSAVNNLIVEEVDSYNGFVRTLQDDQYIFGISKGALADLESKSFPLLDRIRQIPTTRKIPVTVSVGIAIDGKTVKEHGERARAALDLALGRGGDQVCIVEKQENRFYGGKTTSAEKNTRVRARVVAQAIRELMEEADRILIMGHEREDYDALGGALGILTMAQAMGKEVRLALSHHTESIDKMLASLTTEQKGVLINGEEAAKWVTDQTLVFVMDVHRPSMVAAPNALEKAKRRVVIDHHRRAADFIESPLLTYLEPSASSTSELVTELIQYFELPQALSKSTATGIYAGIVLDTKNFNIQTGARTFDAAAYLRRAGADIGLVQSLFRDSFDEVQMRAKILYMAEVADGIAVAEAPEGISNISAIAAQAADMLNATDGIEASFVLYHLSDGGISVSARSKGALNVQLVMEAIGGGGHRTVAGAQISDMSMDEIKAAIRSHAIEQMKSLEEAE